MVKFILNSYIEENIEKIEMVQEGYKNFIRYQ